MPRGSALLVRAACLALALALAPPLATAAQAASAQTPESEQAHFHAGEELARTVALVTGVPISPLLGVSGLGAVRYFQTPEGLRPTLPWYARPWFWASGLALVFLFAANTTIGAMVPGLKKPMDFVEEHENKLSALIASPVVLLEAKRLLTAAGVLGAAAGAGVDSHPLASAGLAAVGSTGGIDPYLQPLLALGLGVLSLACYGVVFLAFHAIQVLIALSPSALLDMLLRLFRLSMLGLLVLAETIHPYLGAALGLAILVVSWLLAGWSFRLTVFGSVLSWDFLSSKEGTANPAAAPLAAFAARGFAGAPVRAFGRLEPAQGGAGWLFRWRPWLVLPARRVALPAPTRWALRRGAVSPTLFALGGLREPTLFRFPPRFRGREEELAQRLGAEEIRDGRIVRGVRAAWRLLRELVLGTEPADVSAG